MRPAFPLTPDVRTYVRLYRIRPGVLRQVEGVTRRAASRDIIRIDTRPAGDYLRVTFVRYPVRGGMTHPPYFT